MGRRFWLTRLRQLRESRGWSQAQIAVACECTPNTVARWERLEMSAEEWRAARVGLCFRHICDGGGAFLVGDLDETTDPKVPETRKAFLKRRRDQKKRRNQRRRERRKERKSR